jgi:hypothetical protein
MATNEILAIVAALSVLVAVLVLGAWAVRQQNRAFPKGFDRVGWNPDRKRASWFRTQFFWLFG